MPVTVEQVRSYLDAEEPDYSSAAQLGEGATEPLARIVQGTDVLLASKAAYLAGLIPAASSVEVLKLGAASSHAVIRVAAAAAIRNMPSAGSLLEKLLQDGDFGVRKQALISAGVLKPAKLKPLVQKVSMSDASPLIRQLAENVLSKFP